MHSLIQLEMRRKQFHVLIASLHELERILAGMHVRIICFGQWLFFCLILGADSSPFFMQRMKTEQKKRMIQWKPVSWPILYVQPSVISSLNLHWIILWPFLLYTQTHKQLWQNHNVPSHDEAVCRLLIPWMWCLDGQFFQNFLQEWLHNVLSFVNELCSIPVTVTVFVFVLMCGERQILCSVIVGINYMLVYCNIVSLIRFLHWWK